jgi:hypothetical protein
MILVSAVTVRPNSGNVDFKKKKRFSGLWLDQPVQEIGIKYCRASERYFEILSNGEENDNHINCQLKSQ